MRLISTLCDSQAIAMKILRDVPDNSIVLLPETLTMISKQIIKFSKEKNLFISYQSDTIIDDKVYVNFRGIDQGEEVWQVKKFNLWHTDKSYYSPGKAEPIISIRGHKSGLFICFDAVKIFKMTPILNREKIEYLLIPANWKFNFELIDRIADFSLQQIPSLKAVCFSCTNTVAFVKSRRKERRIKKSGYVELLV